MKAVWQDAVLAESDQTVVVEVTITSRRTQWIKNISNLARLIARVVEGHCKLLPHTRGRSE